MTVEQKTTLKVDGMTCGSCVRHVNNALNDISGVQEVEVNLREGRVLVRHDLEKAPTSALIEALADAGYESQASG